MVEFAVLLPGRGEGALLPIDSKFPIEEYRRLIDAEEAGGKEAAERARKHANRESIELYGYVAQPKSLFVSFSCLAKKRMP